MDIYEWAEKQGIHQDSLKVDNSDEIYVEIDGIDDKGRPVFEEIGVPPEFNTPENIKIIRTNQK